MRTIIVALPRRKELHFIIWHTETQYDKEIRSIPDVSKTSIGCYFGPDARHGKVYQIHLIKKYIGAGYVCHEVLHFWIDYVRRFITDITNKNEEGLVIMFEDIIREFWNKYYEGE